MTRHRNHDPRQLHLFDAIAPDDPVRTYYRKLRKIGATLSFDADFNQIVVFALGAIPLWATKTALELHARVKADLLRVEHGIEPPREIQQLDGGAVLHKLPARRAPEDEPPVKKPAVTQHHRGPGAA